MLVSDDELLSGDGYDDLLKPFRTLEDTHVFAAVLGWALGVGHSSGWDRAWTERALALLVVLREIGRSAPSAPATHVALAGAMDLGRSLLDDRRLVPRARLVRLRWERDRPLLDVARKVREAKVEGAWRALVSSF